MAEIMPSVVPTTSEKSMAVNVSSSVAGKRAIISFSTGSPVR
jgi:hypothetical protein